MINELENYFEQGCKAAQVKHNVIMHAAIQNKFYSAVILEALDDRPKAAHAFKMGYEKDLLKG